MKWYQMTDVGKVRDQNEDYVLVEQLPDGKSVLGIVCDGMGGCLAGEVASEEAAEMMRSAFLEQFEAGGGKAGEIRSSLSHGVKSANARVWHLSASEDEYMGMGTTLTAVWTDGKSAWFVSVGDSRGYILRSGSLIQVTEDQSYVWELYKQGAITKEQMRTHPMNHLVSMAVGLKPDLREEDIGIFQYELESDDEIFLCSDGVTDVLPEEQVASTLSSEKTLEGKCKSVIDACNSSSGKDNISVVLIRQEGYFRS